MADAENSDFSADVNACGLSLEEAAKRVDVGAQPGPDDPEIVARDFAKANDLSQVRWPSDDRNAPDYAYVAAEANPPRFKLTAQALELLLKHHRYVPEESQNTVAIALRGARLAQGFEVEKADEIELDNVRPDHRHFCCVLGFYFTDTRKFSLFTGSTVPCRRAVWGFANGGDAANMLPTGMHTMYVWRHKSLRPALRLAKSSLDPETGAQAAVLRNRNDLTYGTQDPFDLSVPLDNVHCSYFLNESASYGASFSSWGCLTVRGEQTPSHQWKKYQQILGTLGERARVDLVLATGKDVALAATQQGDQASLERTLGVLRRGSQGDEVKRLQEKIGLTGAAVDGWFGPVTLDRYVKSQRTLNQEQGNGPTADGIYSKSTDAATGWGVFVSA